MTPLFSVYDYFLTHRGNSGFWFGDSYMLRDGARSHGIQTTILHSRGGLRGLGFFFTNSRRLLLVWKVVLAAAWLALLHAGRAGGHSDFGATHCTLNRGESILWLEDEDQRGTTGHG